MAVAMPGSDAACHSRPFQDVTAGWPGAARENTSPPSTPDGSRWLVAASEVAGAGEVTGAGVPGSSRTAHLPAGCPETASASRPRPSMKKTRCSSPSGPVVTADNGLPAATPNPDRIRVLRHPRPADDVTIRVSWLAR